MGSSGLEPPTSCLSGTRSNLLSYEPRSFSVPPLAPRSSAARSSDSLLALPHAASLRFGTSVPFGDDGIPSRCSTHPRLVGSDSPQDCPSLPTCSNPFFCSGPSGSLGGDDGIPSRRASALVVVGSDSPQDCHSLPTCSNPFFCSGPSGSLGGDDGIRTHDPLLAGQVLSHLSYTPMGSQPSQVAVSATSYPPAPSPVQYYRHRRA